MAAQTNVLSEVLQEAGGWAGRLRALLRQPFPPPCSAVVIWSPLGGLPRAWERETNATDLKGQWEAPPTEATGLVLGRSHPELRLVPRVFWRTFLSNSLPLCCNPGTGPGGPEG